MAMSLADQGAFTLDDFRRHLIAAISQWEATNGADRPYHYYERWQEALESIVAASNLVATTAIDDRVAEFTLRPHGHDH